MIKRIKARLSGDGLKARSLRGSSFTLVEFGTSNILRLVSNLILTRLLFPEAFGLMALVHVFTAGIAMFSDIGIRTSVIRSGRGDDPTFLNTAWTLQILRGVVLWLLTCLMAWPAMWIYDEPLLGQLLPVVGFSSVIGGFATTNVITADRHIRLGRVTLVRIAIQVMVLIVTAGLAWWLQSVWALVFGGLAGAAIRVIMLHITLPGIRNRLCFDRSALSELLGFGKFILLSTIAGFISRQADRAILGAFVPLEILGIYYVGSLLGTLPSLMGRALISKVVFPLYRMRPPAESDANRRKIQTARRLAIGPTLALTVVAAFLGVPLVELLYDERYALAGPMVTLFCMAMIPRISFSAYNNALLAAGDGRRYMILQVTLAVLATGFILGGTMLYGVAGAILGQGLSILAVDPMRRRFLRPHKVADGKTDALFLVVGYGLTALACWWHRDAIALLFATGAA